MLYGASGAPAGTAADSFSEALSMESLGDPVLALGAVPATGTTRAAGHMARSRPFPSTLGIRWDLTVPTPTPPPPMTEPSQVGAPPPPCRHS